MPTLRDARIEAVGDGVILVDVRRRIADLNPAAEGILGCTRAEAAGTRLERFLPQLSAEALPDSRMDVTIGSGPEARIYDLSAAETRSRAGETTGAVVVLRDVTERRLAERALRASEHRYRTVIEQAFDGVWLADAAGTIVDVNPGACTMLGYGRAELIGRRVADLLGAGRLGGGDRGSDCLGPIPHTGSAASPRKTAAACCWPDAAARSPPTWPSARSAISPKNARTRSSASGC